MTCTSPAPGVIVCFASDRFLRKAIRRCPVCECMTEMVERHEAWYGTSTYCCKCGDRWSDGELGPRPFRRGWRREAVQRHREMWDRATFGPPPDLLDLYPELGEQDVVDVELPDDVA